MSFHIFADNTLEDILVNGRSTGISTPPGSPVPFTFQNGIQVEITSAMALFQTGANTLTFIVRNSDDKNGFGGPTGMRIDDMTAGYSTQVNDPLKLSGLQISDADAGGGIMTVTLSVNSGSLMAVDAGGVTVAGTGSNQLVLSGTLANLNNYLSNSSYQPEFTSAQNATGRVTLTMTTNDGGNTGIDPNLTGGPNYESDTDVMHILVSPEPLVIDVLQTDSNITASNVAEVFDWNFTPPPGAQGNPGVDTISNFSISADALDLRDLLQGESHAGISLGNLDTFLNVAVVNGDTEIRISSTGGFAGGTYNSGEENQRIVLDNVDLVASLGLAPAASNQDIIAAMLNNGKLITD